jgi:biotin operon repressor
MNAMPARQAARAAVAPKHHSDWTEAEDDMLRDLYGRISNKALATRLGRTRTALITRAYLLRVGYNDSFYTTAQVATIFGVDGGTILMWVKRGWMNARRSNLHLKWGRPLTRIDHSDIQRCIRQHPELCDLKRMNTDGNGYWLNYAKLWVSKAKVIKPRARAWTDTETAYLLANFRTQTSRELANHLQRSIGSVQHQVGKLRQEGTHIPLKDPIIPDVAAHPWTPVEDEYVRSNYHRARSPEEAGAGYGAHITAHEIGATLGRSRSDVSKRVVKLGLNEHRPGPWTPVEDEYVRSNYRRLRRADEPGFGKYITTRDLATALGRTHTAINNRIDDLHLRRSRKSAPEPEAPAIPVAPAPAVQQAPKVHPWRRANEELFRRRTPAGQQEAAA